MDKSIDQIHDEGLREITAATDRDGVEAVIVRYLGRKGIVTQFLRNISSLPVEERPNAGKRANEVKISLDQASASAMKAFETKPFHIVDRIDVSLPGRGVTLGSLHPLTQVTQQICDIFTGLGFAVAEGPEVELDYYNFEALNIPKNHPARDMQDTFYVSDNIVLRTHTSPIQIRTMKKHKPPLRIIAPGKVYRCDSDLTHTPMFHQIEGLMVGENISFGDLKGILTYFIHKFFDDQTALKFRPSFFPFTEPSAEVDILCVMCRGRGCRVCSQTGWLEVLGAGMVHPAVFENVGYDTSKITGFAFGMGIERLTMLKYGVDDIRLFFENDLRLLRQF
ncbi:MAG: phenylalanine--tRNA ligase subunit alpha [Desulfobacterales bacterium]|nr:phenylalanine--tRNA ligase subunit alpha [Desulfobacterales bacterium]